MDGRTGWGLGSDLRCWRNLAEKVNGKKIGLGSSTKEIRESQSCLTLKIDMMWRV